MITHALINPRSIAVIGGSNHIHKPGGRLVKNLIEGPFTGDLYIVNPKERLIQGRPVTRNVNDLPTGIELGGELVALLIQRPFGVDFLFFQNIDGFAREGYVGQQHKV